jgi:hypothetical protein
VGAHHVKKLDLPGVGVHADPESEGSKLKGPREKDLRMTDEELGRNFISKQKETDKGKQLEKTITKEEK